MKIKLTKKRGSATLRFKAENDTEGVDLKEVVLGMAKSGSTELVTDAIEELGKRGYKGGLTKETARTREFTVTKAGGAK